MRTATVEDKGTWLCSPKGGSWTIVRADYDQEVPSVPPELIGAIFHQVAECRVDGRTALVLFANHPPLADDEWRSLGAELRQRFAGAPLIVALQLSDGRMGADSSFCDGEDEETTACLAAAVIQARWSWDESPRILVDTGRRSVLVEPRCDGKVWRARLVAPEECN